MVQLEDKHNDYETFLTLLWKLSKAICQLKV